MIRANGIDGGKPEILADQDISRPKGLRMLPSILLNNFTPTRKVKGKFNNTNAVKLPKKFPENCWENDAYLPVAEAQVPMPPFRPARCACYCCSPGAMVHTSFRHCNTAEALG